MTEAATSTAPLIPLKVLFGNQERTQPRLSPDGQRLAYIAPLDGVLNVWVGPVGSDAGGGAFEPVTRDTDRGIRLYFWAEDGRHLVYLQDKGGDENWRLYAVDPATNRIRDLTPFENVQARPLEKNKRFPDELLVELNRRDPRLHDVHRLNLATGDLELVAENPGNVAGWVADVGMRVRGALSAYPDGGFGLLVRKTEEDDWHELLRWGPEDGLNSGPVGFSEDGARMFLKDSREANAARLVRLDLHTEEVEILAEDPDYDVSGVLVHPDTREVQAATVTRARTEWIVFDEAVREDFAAIAKLHPVTSPL
jgi:dipeptidyl aminopeptidase/acylaminoacyl peptidase